MERQHQTAMMEACDTGDVALLRRLFEAAGVKKGDAPVEPSWISYPSDCAPVPASGPAATSSLVSHAVKHKHDNVLAYLLNTYPTASVNTDAILAAACADPHLPSIELLCARDPSIVDHEFEEAGYGETMLMKACGTGDPLLPAFLLDHGADVNESVLGAFQGPLSTAVESSQALWMIEKMVAKGARVHQFCVVAAIRNKRSDVARFFLGQCWIDNEAFLEGNDALLSEARGLDDGELMTVLKGRVKKEISNSTIWKEKGEQRQGG